MSEVRLLLAVDDAVLERLLTAAVSGVDPEDAMAPVPGSPGWTPARRDAFRAYHRSRRAGLDGPHREVTYAVERATEVVGAARLARLPEPGHVEAGLWLTRAARGRGTGTAVLHALLTHAAAAGYTTMVAETMTANRATVRLLTAAGATLSPAEPDGHRTAIIALVT